MRRVDKNTRHPFYSPAQVTGLSPINKCFLGYNSSFTPLAYMIASAVGLEHGEL